VSPLQAPFNFFAQTLDTYSLVEVNLRPQVFAHHVPVVDASLTVKVRHFAQGDRVDHITPAPDHLLLFHVGLLFL
jgi:hypothetical protein